MILVTCYENPDIDGVASSYAYAEYLRKRGFDAKYGIFGKPRNSDTIFVCDKFNIKLEKPADKKVVAIVDASDTWGLSKNIDPNDVIVVIDHRKVHNAHKFKHASIQIEEVGAAATLIAEKFYDYDVKPSKETAILLYSAIVMNTINFKANVTRKRDIQMADWLKTFVKLDNNYLHQLFKHRSRIELPLQDHLDNDFSVFGKVGIAQLEIVDVEKFVEKNIEEIQDSLKNISDKRELEYIFLSCIDIEKAFNLFIVIDEKTQKLVENTLKIQFKDNKAKREGIIMRKEIAPLLKNQQP